jgi:hypothetical protein
MIDDDETRWMMDYREMERWRDGEMERWREREMDR